MVYQLLHGISTLRVVSTPPFLYINSLYRMRISSSTYRTYLYHQLLQILSTYYHLCSFLYQLFRTQNAYQLFHISAFSRINSGIDSSTYQCTWSSTYQRTRSSTYQHLRMYQRSCTTYQRRISALLRISYSAHKVRISFFPYQLFCVSALVLTLLYISASTCISVLVLRISASGLLRISAALLLFCVSALPNTRSVLALLRISSCIDSSTYQRFRTYQRSNTTHQCPRSSTYQRPQSFTYQHPQSPTYQRLRSFTYQRLCNYQRSRTTYKRLCIYQRPRITY